MHETSVNCAQTAALTRKGASTAAMTDAMRKTSLVWRRLAHLHEEHGSHIVWTAGLSERCRSTVCHIALKIGFVSVQRLGGFLLLKHSGAERPALPNKSGSAEATEALTIDRCVVQKVEEYVQKCMIDFVQRRDRYLDLCVSCYPLPSATVSAICCHCAARLGLQSLHQGARTVRVVKRDVCKTWKSRRRGAEPCRPPIAQLQIFPGAIVYIRQFADAQFCCELLRKSGIQLFGMDTEWKPNREASDDDHPTALLQLCFKTPEKMKRGCLELPTARGAEYTCFLLHILHHGVNPALADLLSDASVAKVGVEVDGDVQKLRQHYGVNVASAVELHQEAQQRRIHVRGLRSLFGAAVGYDYPKDKSVTMSNWEVAPLSAQQQNYAACDAFAALRIYETLKSGSHHHRAPLQ